MQKEPICHIIGGGLSGVACAYFLRQMRPDMHSIIYDEKAHLGGKTYCRYDIDWRMEVDNALHTIFDSNAFMSRFVEKEEWKKNAAFVNFDDLEDSLQMRKNKDILLKKICNMAPDKIADKVKKQTMKMLFPHRFSSPKIYAFDSNLTPRLINNLAAYADLSCVNQKLRRISGKDGTAKTLWFGNQRINLRKGDRVILAVDNVSAADLLGLERLELTQKASIAYYTSQMIFLPYGVSFVGVRGGACDWIAVSSDILAAEICDYNPHFATTDKLAIHVWEDIAKIRRVNSAFVPSYKLEVVENASVRLDEKNNAKRLDNANTQYENVFICGDWTMKNYPCMMETAVLSSKRAVKTMLRTMK